MAREPRSILLTPPPLVFAAGLFAGWLIDRARPWRIVEPGDAAPWDAAGWGLIAAGALLGIWANVAFSRASAPALPLRPTPAIVTSGPYRFTRNPMYIGLTLAYLGFNLVFLNTWWPVVLLPIVLAVMRYRVIALEERYLAEQFGAEYEEYRRRVRRWI